MLNLVSKIRPTETWRIPLVGSLLVLMTVLGTNPVPADTEDTVWLRIEVMDRSDDHARVKIKVPISLIEVVVDSVDRKEFLSNLHGHHSLDLARIWREVRGMEMDDFITVESDDGNVRVWKDRDFLRVDLRGSRTENVAVKVPLELMDYLFEADQVDFSFNEMIERLREHLPLVMIEAESDDESVRIWLEEEP